MGSTFGNGMEDIFGTRGVVGIGGTIAGVGIGGKSVTVDNLVVWVEERGDGLFFRRGIIRDKGKGEVFD